jgi:hypothetical protein
MACKIIEVVSPGPQGPVGPTGPAGLSSPAAANGTCSGIILLGLEASPSTINQWIRFVN